VLRGARGGARLDGGAVRWYNLNTGTSGFPGVRCVASAPRHAGSEQAIRLARKSLSARRNHPPVGVDGPETGAIRAVASGRSGWRWRTGGANGKGRGVEGAAHSRWACSVSWSRTCLQGGAAMAPARSARARGCGFDGQRRMQSPYRGPGMLSPLRPARTGMAVERPATAGRPSERDAVGRPELPARQRPPATGLAGSLCQQPCLKH
jgi:hypothetical protein